MSALILKKLCYFMQTVSLFENTGKSFMRPFIEICNLRIREDGAFYPKLTRMFWNIVEFFFTLQFLFHRFQLLWLEFLIPVTLFSCVMLLSSLSNLNIWERATEFLKYGIAAFWVVFAIAFGQIAMTLLKLLACR